MALCDVPVISTVCDAVGEGAASLITAPFDILAQGIANAAAWMFEGVWTIFDSTTLVDLTGEGYIDVYNIVFGIAVLITFAFFCLQLVGSLIRREPGALGRAATGIAKSILGAFVLVTVTAILLEIVDQLCIGIVQATGTSMEEMGTKIGLLVGGLLTLNLAAPGATAIVVIFLGFLAMAAAAIVWFSLLIRKCLILILVVLGPIALAGASWDVTRGWFAKWASFVLALIFSKFVVVLIFLIAISQVSVPIELDVSSIADPIAGVVLMLIAGFAPYMCFKLMSFAGVDMYALASTEQEAKQSVNRPLPISHTPKPEAPAQILQGKNDPAPSGDPKPPATDSTPVIPGDGGGGGGSSPVANAGTPAAAEAGAEGTAVKAGSTAGPVGLAVVGGVAVAKGVAEAGPKAGAAVGQAAEQYAQGASDGASAPPATQPPTPAHTSPAPPPAQQEPPAPPADPVPPKN